MDNVSSLVEQLRSKIRRQRFKKLLQSSEFKRGAHKHFYFDVIGMYLDAYVAASETALDILVGQINVDDEICRRIFIEAAFASVAAQDLTMPGDHSRIDFLKDNLPGSAVLMYQGLGGAFASTNLDTTSLTNLRHNFFGWMALDCFGFHKGYFEWSSTIDKMSVPVHLDELGRYAFDCGVGRAIWLIGSGQPRIIAELISRFARERRCALWAGIGLYAAFLGTHDQNDLKRLRRLAGNDLPYLQEGIALGTFILNDAKQELAHTKAACELICSASLPDVLNMAISQLALNSTGEVTAKNFYNWKRNMSGFFGTHR